MYGARQRFLGAICAAATLLGAAHASAFHAGNMFDRAPGGGGGGGLFYTGSPREHGFTCTACHLDAPRTARVEVSSDPAELVAERRYRPLARYRLTFELAESLGLGSPLSNYNTLALTALDGDSRAAGSFSGYAAQDFHARGSAILASAGSRPNETLWSFDWTAPESGTGDVDLFVAVVDGNGANSAPDVTLTDPFGDDVALGVLSLGESRATAAASRGAARGRPALGVASAELGLSGAVVALALTRLARRGRAQSPVQKRAPSHSPSRQTSP